MVRWGGHILHTVPYCAIVLQQNRHFPAPGQRGVIVALMMSLIQCLCHRWHGCHRGVIGDIACTSWWGGEDIYYILCHIVSPFPIVLQQNRPFPSSRTAWRVTYITYCAIVAMMVSLIPCLWHRWHECHRGVMGDIAYTSWWGGEDIYYILCHIVPLFYTKIALSQLQDSVSLIQCLWHRWHECHRGVMGDIACTSWWGGEDIYYILCHSVPLFYNRIALSQLQDSVVSLLPWWCHWFHVCDIGDMSAIVVSWVT